MALSAIRSACASRSAPAARSRAPAARHPPLGRAEIPERLADAEQGVGALARARPLDDVERIVGEVAREHAIGGDVEVDRRQLALAGLLQRADRLVLVGGGLQRAGMILDGAGDGGAERLEHGLDMAQPQHRIGAEIDLHRPAGGRGQGACLVRAPGRRRAPRAAAPRSRPRRRGGWAGAGGDCGGWA